ncbi:MAG: hypothetical protein OXH49_14160 [Gemmatimonadetes bacterium]|nr:hypothetical protein [Gemmatimonadota bacterium]
MYPEAPSRGIRAYEDVDLDQIRLYGAHPISLIRWEMTGLDDEVRDLWKRKRLNYKE